jgi:hypothetical protein
MSPNLDNAKANGAILFSAAYMMNDLSNFSHVSPNKHPRYIRLLKDMMSTNVTGKLQAARTYYDAFKVLQTYPLHADFIAMQHLTDLNYSNVINFSENDFIVPGPGALNGIAKCWSPLVPGVTHAQIIQMCVSDQDAFLAQVGEQPIRLNGKRELHAIDCQNLFCETDKYSRVAHPQFNLPGRNGQPKNRIKQTLKPKTGPLPAQFFPPKWGI